MRLYAVILILNYVVDYANCMTSTSIFLSSSLVHQLIIKEHTPQFLPASSFRHIISVSLTISSLNLHNKKQLQVGMTGCSWNSDDRKGKELCLFKSLKFCLRRFQTGSAIYLLQLGRICFIVHGRYVPDEITDQVHDTALNRLIRCQSLSESLQKILLCQFRA